MKKLVAYDFDGTLADTPHPDTGKGFWKEKTGEEYPHKGWWGRRESLDTNVFDIPLFPSIENKLRHDVADPDTHVIILTSRLERLRPELETILNQHGVVVDEVIMKDGAADKGDILLNYVKNNPDLKQIDMYDDFAEGQQHKIEELTKIKDILPEDIEYNIFFVQDGNVKLMESTNLLRKIIHEEIINLK